MNQCRTNIAKGDVEEAAKKLKLMRPWLSDQEVYEEAYWGLANYRTRWGRLLHRLGHNYDEAEWPSHVLKAPDPKETERWQMYVRNWKPDEDTDESEISDLVNEVPGDEVREEH